MPLNAQAVMLLQLLVHANTDAKLAALVERLYGRFRERLALVVAEVRQLGTIRSDVLIGMLRPTEGAAPQSSRRHRV